MKCEEPVQENNEQKAARLLSAYEKEKEEKIVNLIAKLIVDLTFKEVYEKSH
ncbi:hypothetical protein [Filimonas effusa]|uniref:hypothetical protein n=1 Tax=Filimonas effusa TaxID=2508721 RepID=UPI00119A0D99|nr:hypothetical protein [Filimonas effusa]